MSYIYQYCKNEHFISCGTFYKSIIWSIYVLSSFPYTHPLFFYFFFNYINPSFGGGGIFSPLVGFYPSMYFLKLKIDPEYTFWIQEVLPNVFFFSMNLKHMKQRGKYIFYEKYIGFWYGSLHVLNKLTIFCFFYFFPYLMYCLSLKKKKKITSLITMMHFLKPGRRVGIS